jgi:hypothetical protein
MIPNRNRFDEHIDKRLIADLRRCVAALPPDHRESATPPPSGETRGCCCH